MKSIFTKNKFFRLYITVLKYIVYCVNKLYKQVEKEKAILVISYFNLGDLVCDLQSLEYLKEFFVDHKIVCLVRNKKCEEFMMKYSNVDVCDIITSDTRTTIDYIKDIFRYSKIYQFESSFQLVRPFTQVRKTAIPYILNVKNRYGLICESDNFDYRPYFTKYYLIKNKLSRKEESLKVCELVGIRCEFASPKIDLNIAKNEDFLKLNTHILNEKYIVIHPGATVETKRWSAENYIKLINIIKKNYNIKIVVTGTEDEMDLINKIKAKANVDYFFTNISIDDFLIVIKKSELVITNDTGPLHFAIALDKYVIAIFGPTIPNYAVGTNLSERTIIIRGATFDCDINSCSIYTETNDKLKDICNDKQRVCIDKVDFKIVYKYVELILDNEICNSGYPTNLQGYTT